MPAARPCAAALASPSPPPAPAAAFSLLGDDDEGPDSPVLGSRRATAAPAPPAPAPAAQDDGMDLIRLSPSPGPEQQPPPQQQQQPGGGDPARTLSDQLSLTDSLAEEMGYQGTKQ